MLGCFSVAAATLQERSASRTSDVYWPVSTFRGRSRTWTLSSREVGDRCLHWTLMRPPGATRRCADAEEIAGRIMPPRLLVLTIDPPAHVLVGGPLRTGLSGTAARRATIAAGPSRPPTPQRRPTSACRARPPRSSPSGPRNAGRSVAASSRAATDRRRPPPDSRARSTASHRAGGRSRAQDRRRSSSPHSGACLDSPHRRARDGSGALRFLAPPRPSPRRRRGGPSSRSPPALRSPSRSQLDDPLRHVYPRHDPHRDSSHRHAPGDRGHSSIRHRHAYPRRGQPRDSPHRRPRHSSSAPPCDVLPRRRPHRDSSHRPACSNSSPPHRDVHPRRHPPRDSPRRRPPRGRGHSSPPHCDVHPHRHSPPRRPRRCAWLGSPRRPRSGIRQPP